MTIWKSIYKQKKMVLPQDKIVDWHDKRWLCIGYAQPIRCDTQELLYVMAPYDSSYYAPISPFDHLILNQDQLEEYFMETTEVYNDLSDTISDIDNMKYSVSDNNCSYGLMVVKDNQIVCYYNRGEWVVDMADESVKSTIIGILNK